MRYATLLLLLPSLVLGPAGARAHAYLDRATPLVGSTVAASPGQVVLRFTQNLERRFSRVEVRNAAGGRVDQGNISVSGSVMRVGLKGRLAPGRYSVHWRVLSVDTHTTEGFFGFNVGR
jgi:methionine-rich copper-binding protein CopC